MEEGRPGVEIRAVWTLQYTRIEKGKEAKNMKTVDRGTGIIINQRYRRVAVLRALYQCMQDGDDGDGARDVAGEREGRASRSGEGGSGTGGQKRGRLLDAEESGGQGEGEEEDGAVFACSGLRGATPTGRCPASAGSGAALFRAVSPWMGFA